jgi:hypothetical protein
MNAIVLDPMTISGHHGVSEAIKVIEDQMA